MNERQLQNALSEAQAALTQHQFGDALPHLLKALSLKPEDADIALLAADTSRRCGDIAQAARLYRQATENRPGFFAAYCNLGAAERETGNFPSAIEALLKALLLNPDSVEALCNLGLTFRQTGQTEKALDCFGKAIYLQPHQPFQRMQYAETAFEAGRTEDAYRILVEGLSPDCGNTELICAKGRLELSLDRYEDAKNTFITALQLNPQLPEAHYALGTIMREWRQLDEAIICYRNALQFRPGDINSLVNLGEVFQRAGLIDESEECFRSVIERAPDCRTALHNLLVSITYNSRYSAQEVIQKHIHLCGTTGRSDMPYFVPKRESDDRIRIGYLSPDFCNHPAAAFLYPMLRHHNRKRFELYCYAQNTFTDSSTDSLRSLADHWRQVYHLDDEACVTLIRHDQIDILIDTAGHFTGNRFEMLGLRAAPLQISGIGYPGPTGSPAIDSRITDDVIDPPARDDELPDKPLRLPRSFCCYTPPEPLPDVSPLPAREKGHITFGSLHTTARLNRETIRLWSDVLAEVPNAEMVICRDTLTHGVIERLSSWFSEFGIGRQRVSYESVIPAEGHLALYHRIDITLDTTPWSGHTTACESLIMGVPVVTLAGDRHAGRMVASVLHTVGLDDWIALLPADFSAIANGQAADIATLTQIRATLRDHVLASPLCDGAAYMHELEKKFLSLVLS